MTLLRFICLILVPLPSLGLAQTLDANLKPPATQSYEDLRDYGPRGGQVILSEDSYDGTSSLSIGKIGPGVIPLGGLFTLEIPRRIAPSNMPTGHTIHSRGKPVRIHDKDLEPFGRSPNITLATAGAFGRYAAYPNAVDFLGNDMALIEILTFQSTYSGWNLIRLPERRLGFTAGDPEFIESSTSRRGFAWVIHADGSARITNGTVRLRAHSVGSGSGDNGPRFREDFEFPFRLEQHVGYHRNAHFGISTKSTDVSYSALSVPRHSRTLEDTFRVTVYVADIEQSEVKADDHVSITISFDGNWKLEGTPLAIDFGGHWAVDDTPISKLRVTAKLGNTSAQAMLGVLYANGRGVELDYVRAHMWFDIASANGDENAGLARKTVSTRMSADEIAQAQQRAQICMTSDYHDCAEPVP